jgi:hypothetical protein
MEVAGVVVLPAVRQASPDASQALGAVALPVKAS